MKYDEEISKLQIVIETVDRSPFSNITVPSE